MAAIAPEATVATPAPAATELPKIKVHWLEKSRSQRILWLLEECKVPYEIEIYHRNKATLLAPPELKKIHPVGHSPVVEITPPGQTQPIVLAESAFITEYIIKYFAKGTTMLPKEWKEGQEDKIGGETEEWLRFRYFMHYAEGSLIGLLVTTLIFISINQRAPFFARPITGFIGKQVHAQFIDPALKTHFTFLESQLNTAPGTTGGNGFLCGPTLTAADILMSFPLIAGKERAGITSANYPKLRAYIDKLEAQPGYKVAVEKIIKLDGKFEVSD